MKNYIFPLLIVSVFAFSSCNNGNTEKTQNEIDLLKKEVNNTYKPGLGEFMLTVQMHHAKLWFSGINENWPLANFELGEIKETFGNAVKYLPERVETKKFPMIYPALDSLQTSIDKQDIKRFTDGFKVLTETCNECHEAVKFPFNVIKVPSSEPVSNQEFKPKHQ
jgi:cytochrome c1